MMIDTREPQVLVRTRTQHVEQTLAGAVGIERAGRDLLEKILKLFV